MSSNKEKKTLISGARSCWESTVKSPGLLLTTSAFLASILVALEPLRLTFLRRRLLEAVEELTLIGTLLCLDASR